MKKAYFAVFGARRRSNLFYSPPAHLCAVTYMNEIALVVTLNNQFTSLYI